MSITPRNPPRGGPSPKAGRVGCGCKLREDVMVGLLFCLQELDIVTTCTGYTAGRRNRCTSPQCPEVGRPICPARSSLHQEQPKSYHVTPSEASRGTGRQGLH